MDKEEQQARDMLTQHHPINPLLAIWALLWLLAMHTSEAAECRPVAKVLSVEGQVQVIRPQSTWAPVKVGDQLCQADTLRTGSKGRAALRMINETLVRMDRQTTLVFTRVHAKKKSLLDLLNGVIHAISRTPRSLNINTPFVNAAIEGTEFVIAAREAGSTITVLEGHIVARNYLGKTNITANQAATTLPDQAPEPAIHTNPNIAIRWAFYYPRILDSHNFNLDAAKAPEAIKSVMSLLESHQASAALTRLQDIPKAAQDAYYHILAAAINLRLGAINDADQHLHAAQSSSTQLAASYALHALVSVVQGQLPEAQTQIDAAKDLNPDSPVVKLANSYLSQAKFAIPQALALATQASERVPESPIAKARTAELLLMTGATQLARKSAYEAALLSPKSAEYQTVLGFASLQAHNLETAQQIFELAIQLDSSAPLPRLGKALVLIRQNHLKAGRESLESAVLLDPGNSLLRSYLGKAYTEERRIPLALEQFELAKQADPSDPTPWFYNAIVLQSLNQPVKALGQHLGAMQRNDNRGVYRSRQLLDQDAAARTVALGRVYHDLGFQQLAKSQAGNALQIDPGNSSAHRLLADSYLGQTNLEGSLQSELLQAQLLQPLNLMTSQPKLATSNQGIFDSAGPGSISFNEYNPMFIHNGWFGQLNASAGEQGNQADDIILSSLSDHLALSLNQHHSENPGLRENADFKNDLYSLFGQFALSGKTQLQFEIGHEKQEKGDVSQHFFPESMNDP
ncbi:MAG TPA: tetratricopeptide repeat protein, partial [Gammaproteobacteria bacterium]|nr:tetratricopeptide repeat protein [Gammaproteobacteria bacterium]